MKASEILRKFADMLDQGSDTNTTNNRLTPVDVEPGDNGGDQPRMVPPLQAKLEILKKSEGLPNVYDTCDSEGESDELSMLKKRAGISASQLESSEDNDITG